MKKSRTVAASVKVARTQFMLGMLIYAGGAIAIGQQLLRAFFA